jgi:lysine 6-dehydrogenase
MNNYLVLGTGMMGKHIAEDLAKDGRVTLTDFNPEKEKIAKELNLNFQQIDVTDHKGLVKLMKSYDVAISAVQKPQHHYLALKAAIDAKCNHCDLGADPETLKKEFQLNKKALKAGITALPDCGVSPGTSNILVGYGASQLDKINRINYFVGGVPLEPKPPLNYTLLFSIKVLLNEYFEESEIIRNGKIEIVQGMSGLEKVTFPGFGKMEAAFVAGQTSTLTKTFEGRVNELYEKTIRYPGHYGKIKMLGRILTRDKLEEYLLKTLPKQDKDALLMKVIVDGKKDDTKTKVTYTLVDQYTNGMTAMSRTTAWPASIVAQMIANKKITKKGVLEQELHVPAEKFMEELKKRGIKIDWKIEFDSR